MKFGVVSDGTSYDWDDKIVIGKLHIHVDDVAFPSENWTDMVCDVLILWTQSLLNLLESDLYGEEEFFFLEKPYSFIVKARGANNAIINLLDDSKPIGCRDSEASFFTILSAICHVVDEVLADERLQSIRQIKRLSGLHTRLKEAATQLGYHMG